MKPRTACSPKNGVHGGEHDGPETSTRSRNSKESNLIRAKKTRRAASRARRTLKCRRLSSLSRKAALMRKTRRRKKQRKNITKKSQCHEDSVAHAAVSTECPQFCDEIESNDADSISPGELCTQTPSKAVGGLENAWRSTMTCPREELFAEEVTAVTILAEVVVFLEGVCVHSVHFIFTDISVCVKISDGNLVTTTVLWPLNEIISFHSYSCQKEGYNLLELGLTNSGAETLKQRMEEMPIVTEHDLLNCKGCRITAKICNFDWPQQKRQIMSLSDAYTLLWRPLRMELNAGQVFGASCLRTDQVWAPVDKESFAEVTEVFIRADDLLLSEDVHICNSMFGFTADNISLRISDGYSDCFNIKWQLNEINSIVSHVCQKESYVWLELGLTDSGAETLKNMLKETPLQLKDDHCLLAKINGVAWTEQHSQINSLSECYKSLLREVFAEQDFDSFQGCQSELVPQSLYGDDFEREDLIDSGDEGSNDQEGSDDRAEQLRHEASLCGWFDIIYPKEDPDAVTVTQTDFLLLNPGEFISDTIIDFYIKYLQSTLSDQDKRRFYFFNSFFFRKLTEIDRNLLHGYDRQKSLFERVKRWTTKINIFEKDYLFIPIMESAHWSLIIICNPGYISAEFEETIDSRAPIILHFDSLEGCHNGLEEPIRNYLLEAWTHGKSCTCQILPCMCKSLSEVKFMSAKVPQQTNYSDCGLFLLHYVELFIREVHSGNFPQFLTCEWFDPLEASKKRVDIKRLILRLRAEELDGGAVFGCLDFQDGPVFNGNNGEPANGPFLLQEVATISNDVERQDLCHNTSLEQMGGAIASAPLICSNQMSMDIFDGHADSTVGIDLYSSMSLDVLAPSCQFTQSGSYKQLFMLCHAGAKFSLEYATEDNASVSEPVSSNPISEDLSPHAINISVHENTKFENVCIPSNPECNDFTINAMSIPHQFSTAAQEGEYIEMATREMAISNIVDGKINQLSLSLKQLGSTAEVALENTESFKLNIEKGIENHRSIDDAEVGDSHNITLQESASTESKPASISSTLNLNATVCSREIESKEEISTDINRTEGKSVDEKLDYRIPSHEDATSMQQDVGSLQQNDRSYKSSDIEHDEELSGAQSALRSNSTHHVSPDVGQSICDHQADLMVESMREVEEIECPSKVDKPKSPVSSQNVSTSVCLNKALPADEICANKNQNENKSLHDCKVTSSADISQIHADLCILEDKYGHHEKPDRVRNEDLHNLQNILTPGCRQCLQSDVGQCADNHQAQPVTEGKKMLENVKVTKPYCRKRLLDSEVLENARQRPITRSATKRNDDKPAKTILSQQGRKECH